MARTKTLKNLQDKKFVTFNFTGFWQTVFGNPMVSGIWLIFGKEKNGKTTFALKLAEYLTQFGKVLYISAEEGTDKEFVDATKRAKLDVNNKKLQFLEHIPLVELDEKLSSRQAAKIVFIDNVTVYKDELAYGGFERLRKKHKNKLIVFIAHEEKNEPYTASAKMIKKLSKIYVRIQGLAAFAAGRCPGGTITIDEKKATLYHGEKIKNQPIH